MVDAHVGVYTFALQARHLHHRLVIIAEAIVVIFLVRHGVIIDRAPVDLLVVTELLGESLHVVRAVPALVA